ncbi:Cys-Gln thioester bond-forming surface protein [Candidatus Binatia bacterium]|nr:Cys-Gln thioester bond-forming surface protein [Candidatus Binatia bacterium]
MTQVVRTALVAAGVTISLAVMSGRTMATCSGGATGELTGTGRGEGVSGTLNGSPHSAGFAGVIRATINGVPNVPTFCINLLNPISVGDCFNAGGPTSPHVTWLLNHGYGPDDNVPGTTAEKNAENAARQAAVWYFSDGFITTDSHQTRVQAIINGVPANPDPQADVPQMNLGPASSVLALPDDTVQALIVNVTLGGQPLVGQVVNLSATFGTLSSGTVTTDGSGAASFTLTNTAGTPGTATVTATFTGALPAGTIFEPVVSGKQRLVLATSANAVVVADATVQWVNGGTIVAHKFLDADADGTQDPDEPNLASWTMRLYACDPACDGLGCSLLTSLTTDSNGNANFGSRPAGCYRVDEVFPAPAPGHHNWRNVTDASQLFTLASNQGVQVVFGNIIDSVIVVQKFNDLDGDGMQDGNELFHNGWLMMLHRLVNGSWIPLRQGLTVDGQVVFSDLPGGHYRIEEEQRSGWWNTTPGNPYELDLAPDSIVTVTFGNMPDCDDNNACTDDSYDQGVQACVHTPLSGPACDDGTACTQTDTCQNGTCVGSNPVVCTALDQCHVAGTCAPNTGLCSNPTAPENTPCNDGSPVTEQDRCVSGVCVGTPPCDDNNACNGIETPNGLGGCLPGVPLLCDDGDACNGVETCNPSSGCQAGTPPTCDDGDVCNGTETCDAQLGCRNGAPLVCSDGIACNGIETCDATAGCLPGTPVDCSAFVDTCHDAACGEPDGACVVTQKIDGFACDDDDVCTLNDRCIAGVCTGATTGDTDGDGYCDLQEQQAQCNITDPREIPPQPTTYAGGRVAGPGEILLTFHAPLDRDVPVATDPSCATVGVCNATSGFCTAGRISDPCDVDADCNLPSGTCRVVVNYASTPSPVPDLALIDVQLVGRVRLPKESILALFQPVTPGCTRKVDVPVGAPGFKKTGVLFKAQGTTGGKLRKDRDLIRYKE